jgi:hypothetical protein
MVELKWCLFASIIFGFINTAVGNTVNGLTATWIISPSGCHILFNFVFAYLFEHSLIAVDVNQSLHEIWGGVFLCIYFRFETIALVLHSKGRTSVLVF